MQWEGAGLAPQEPGRALAGSLGRKPTIRDLVELHGGRDVDDGLMALGTKIERGPLGTQIDKFRHAPAALAATLGRNGNRLRFVEALECPKPV